MAIKAVFDTAGPDGIFLTFLVFRTYPRMSNLDPPVLSKLLRAIAAKAIIKEDRRFCTPCDVKDALRTRNGSQKQDFSVLLLNFNVLIWCENEKV